MRRLIVAFALAALIAWGALFMYAHVLNERAKVIVRTAFELSEQKQAPAITDIHRRFGNRLRLDECRASECGYRVVVSNRILSTLHIVPYTEMESYFWARDGVIFRNMVDYTTTVTGRNRIVSHVQLDLCEGCQTFAIHPWDAASPLDTNGLVEIGNEALAQSRHTVLSFNTSCLTKFGGCQSVADLLPTVWKQTADKRIACVIQNDKGSVQNPANWP